MTERRLALRQAREQSAFDLPDTAEDDVRALPSVSRILNSTDEEEDERETDGAEPYEGPVAGDDDEDDELDGPDEDEDFYADALEDA
ncbi:hypothetical protein ACFV8E_21195 [Streptomyces sp. NPDC059849]|uniref:hypothetical protein n=1 Tax=Streptomyces sp. NPDC059849 TaxID=3346969 RepID=UPI0036669BB2